MSATTSAKALGLAVAALCVATAAPANEAGRAKSATCAACHGPLGLATVPDAPHLAGQSAIYVEAQLKAYRSGARQHPVMNVIAQYLSDADISALAAWYASLKVEVKAP